MKKEKALCTLVSLIMIVSLVGCGGATAAETTTSAPMPAPVVTESTPEPEPEVTIEEAVEETPAEEVVEEPAAEEVEEVEEEPVEEEPAEPTEEEIIAEVLANEEFYEGDVFTPRLYAESIGYKWCGEYDGDEVDFSIIVNNVEYFVWFLAKHETFCVSYTDGEKCYRLTVADLAPDERADIVKLNAGGTVCDNSRLYVESSAKVFYRLSIGDTDLKNWSFEDLPKCYAQYDCEPQFFDDGYIDSTKFTNKNEEESDPPIDLDAIR